MIDGIVPGKQKMGQQILILLKPCIIGIYIYLGLGLFFTIFFPYFLHLNPSSSISTSDLVLNATLSLASLFSVLPLLMSPMTQPNDNKQKKIETKESKIMIRS